MALVSSVTDNFDDNSINGTIWSTFTTGSATVAETTSKIVITPANSTVNSKGVLYSSAYYDLTDNYCLVEVPLVADTTNVYTELNLQIDSSNYIAISISAGKLRAYYIAGGSFNVVADIATYNATTHRWWRMRESGGWTFWDYSADAKTWVNFARLANPITMTALSIGLVANEHTSDATPGVANFDNMNIGVSANAIDGLTDNFDDNAIDAAKWVEYEASSGTITETNSELQYDLANATNGSWAGLYSLAQYNLTGKRVTVKLPASTGTGNSWLDLNLSMEQIPIVDNFFAIGINFGTQEIEAVYELGGADTTAATAAYTNTTDYYLSLRESGGTIYWEYSTNGTSWTELYNHAIFAGIPVTNLYVVLDDYEYDTASNPNVHKFDDFNILPATAIKSVLGLAKASVKSVDALAIASVKSIDGLA